VDRAADGDGLKTPLRARVAYEREQTARRLLAIAPKIGVEVTAEIPLSHPRALADLEELEPVHMLFLEQCDDMDAAAARVLSMSSAQRDLVIVVIVPHPRGEADASLLRSGALAVLDDGPELEFELVHTVAAAQRVVALQEERSQLNSNLAHQDKLSALGVLSAGVSHEINNPCAAILSNMMVLRDQIESMLDRPRFQRTDALEALASDWIEAIGDCINAANRIHSIVKTLNVFSRKSESAPPVPVDVNEEIRTVMRLIGKEVRFQAHFELSHAAGMPLIIAPPNSVTQVVTNLVVNALQAIEAGRVEDPRVWITTAYDDEHIMLEVRDNGPGIPPEVRSRIFDPFFTTKPVGFGTGLGLSICRQLVERMGGEIFVESEPGAGASFSVVLERSEAADAGQRLEAFMPPASDRLRVLLLDDDELILRSMQRSLAPHFECQAVARARAALDVLEVDEEFDVVVSDVVMPEMNGLEFFTELELQHPDLAMRTVFISGGITSELLHTRVSDTGRPCLAKPIDVKELIRTIRRLGHPFEELGR
jgi:signal transduction histidine kinase/ActR/RegA family two-component response regulator